MKNVLTSLAVTVVLLAVSCTSAEIVRTGNKRPALPAGQAVEYFGDPAGAPRDIEELGLLQLEGQLKTTGGMLEEARKRARAMGGNCLVLLRAQAIPNKDWFTTQQNNFVVGYSADVARLEN